MSGGVRERDYPAYPLDELRAAFAAGRFLVTSRVQRYVAGVGWSRTTVRACCMSLQPGDLHKSQAHRDRPGAWLDIYKPMLEQERLYVKITIHENGTQYLVLSFCRDGDAH